MCHHFSANLNHFAFKGTEIQVAKKNKTNMSQVYSTYYLYFFLNSYGKC